MLLPSWKILAGLIAVGMIITGIDLLAILTLPHSILPSNPWLELAGGSLVGAGVGYFVRWIRYNLSRVAAAQKNKNSEQD